MVAANAFVPITQGFINPASTPTQDTGNSPASIAPLAVSNSLTSEQAGDRAHVWLNPRTPHSIAAKLLALETKAPLLYPGMAHLWNALEEQRSAVLRHYLEVSVAPEGVCVAEATNKYGKTYARAQCDRAVFGGKKTFGLGRAGSPEHRAYEQKIAKREALAELGRLEDAARAMVAAAAQFTENLERELEEMPVATFNPAALAAAIAPAAVEPEKVVEPQPAPEPQPLYKGWLGTLDEETLERTLAAMRDCRAASDGYLEQHRKMQPRYGEVAIGSADVDLLIQGEGIATFLGELSKGLAPPEAMEAAVEMAKLIAQKWNKSGTAGRMQGSSKAELERWEDSGVSFLDGVLFSFMDNVRNGRTRGELAAEKASYVKLEDAPKVEPAAVQVAEPEPVPSPEPEAVEPTHTAAPAGYGQFSDLVAEWIEACYPGCEGAIPEDPYTKLPTKVQKVFDVFNSETITKSGDAIKTSNRSPRDRTKDGLSFLAIRTVLSKTAPKEIRIGIAALLERGDITITNPDAHESNYSYVLSPAYFERRADLDKLLAAKAGDLNLQVELGDGAYRLYEFKANIKGAACAKLHADSPRFKSLSCTVLDISTFHTSFIPSLPRYQPKNERYKRTPTKGRGMPKPPKVAKLKDTDQVKFNEKWSAIGAVAMVRPQDGLWQVEVPGYSPMHGTDLSLLDLCVQSIAEQSKIQRRTYFKSAGCFNR
jgi:hypothetical protein